MISFFYFCDAEKGGVCGGGFRQWLQAAYHNGMLIATIATIKKTLSKAVLVHAQTHNRNYQVSEHDMADSLVSILRSELAAKNRQTASTPQRQGCVHRRFLQATIVKFLGRHGEAPDKSAQQTIRRRIAAYAVDAEDPTSFVHCRRIARSVPRSCFADGLAFGSSHCVRHC